jgi:hypothetical protein
MFYRKSVVWQNHQLWANEQASTHTHQHVRIVEGERNVRHPTELAVALHITNDLHAHLETFRALSTESMNEQKSVAHVKPEKIPAACLRQSLNGILHQLTH